MQSLIRTAAETYTSSGMKGEQSGNPSKSWHSRVEEWFGSFRRFNQISWRNSTVDAFHVWRSEIPSSEASWQNIRPLYLLCTTHQQLQRIIQAWVDRRNWLVACLQFQTGWGIFCVLCSVCPCQGQKEDGSGGEWSIQKMAPQVRCHNQACQQAIPHSCSPGYRDLHADCWEPQKNHPPSWQTRRRQQTLSRKGISCRVWQKLCCTVASSVLHSVETMSSLVLRATLETSWPWWRCWPTMTRSSRNTCNPGNFLALMKVLANHDQKLQKHLHAPKSTECHVSIIPNPERDGWRHGLGNTS